MNEIDVLLVGGLQPRRRRVAKDSDKKVTGLIKATRSWAASVLISRASRGKLTAKKNHAEKPATWCRGSDMI